MLKRIGYRFQCWLSRKLIVEAHNFGDCPRCRDLGRFG